MLGSVPEVEALLLRFMEVTARSALTRTGWCARSGYIGRNVLDGSSGGGMLLEVGGNDV